MEPFPNAVPEGDIGYKHMIRSLAFLQVSHRMRRFVPQMFWTGVSIAFYSSALTPMIIDTISTTNMDPNADETDYKL